MLLGENKLCVCVLGSDDLVGKHDETTSLIDYNLRLCKHS